jgi:hypothetical protein
MSAEELKGMDGTTPAVITNPLFLGQPQPLRQGKANAVSYHGHWDVEFEGTNSFITEFKYEG